MSRALTPHLRHDLLILDHHLREGRFQRSLALITAGAALLSGIEVSLEHYRGSYGQRVMYTPVLLSANLAAVATAGVLSSRVARRALPAASIALLLDGLLGFGFHIRGIQRKPGGWRLPVFNIVMGPPLFAPLLLGIAGFLGVLASTLKTEESPSGSYIRQDRFQKVLVAATSVSAILNGFEATYSHYKSGFVRKSQWIPVLLSPPIALTAALSIPSPKMARGALPVMSAAGLAAGVLGFGLHALTSSRRPGGRQLFFYNLVYGPPLLAPLLFSATGFLGLLATRLNRKDAQ